MLYEEAVDVFPTVREVSIPLTPESVPPEKLLDAPPSRIVELARNRRASLPLAVLAAFAVALAAIGLTRDGSVTASPTNLVTNSVPAERPPSIRAIDYVLHEGLSDPIYRAGSIILSVADDSKHGQGSLVETKDGLAILTVNHVAKELGEGSKFYVPGVGTNRLDMRSFTPQPKINKDDDPFALIPLNLSPDHPLMQAVDNGTIKPLILVNPGAKLTAAEVIIVNPVISALTTERVSVYNAYTHQYTLGADVFCEGQSGSPVVMVKNGQATNQVIGVLAGIPPDQLQEDPLGRYHGLTPVSCGTDIRVRAVG